MRALPLRALFFALVLGTAAAAFGAATLVRVDGDVEIGSGTPPSWRGAKAGDVVAAGELIRTAAGARAELKLGDERTARVYERSLLRIGPDAGGAVGSVQLDEGSSLFDLVRRITQGDGFDVHTPEIIVSVKGTRFLVTAAEGADSTSVFRGEVALAGNGFDTISVRPNFTGMRGELSPTPFADPWESWAANATAPVVAIEPESKAELRDAIEKARDTKEQALPSVPAALDGEAKDAGDSSGDGASVEVGDGVRVEAPGIELGVDPAGSSGVEIEVELDPVTDVLQQTVDPVGGTGALLLDTVLEGAPENFPTVVDPGTPGQPPTYDGGPGGAANPFPFIFDVQTSGGPNTVTVEFGIQSVTLDQNEIDTLLTGNRAPLGAFNSVVSLLLVDPVALAGYLDTLI